MLIDFEYYKDAGNLQMLLDSIEAPYKNLKLSTLGGKGRYALMLSLAMSPRDSWKNGIFHNAEYAQFSFDQKGKLELFARSHRIKSVPFRSQTFSGSDGIEKFVNRVNKYVTDAIKALKIDKASDRALRIPFNEGLFRITSDCFAIGFIAAANEATKIRDIRVNGLDLYDHIIKVCSKKGVTLNPTQIMLNRTMRFGKPANGMVVTFFVDDDAKERNLKTKAKILAKPLDTAARYPAPDSMYFTIWRKGEPGTGFGWDLETGFTTLAEAKGEWQDYRDHHSRVRIVKAPYKTNFMQKDVMETMRQILETADKSKLPLSRVIDFTKETGDTAAASEKAEFYVLYVTESGLVAYNSYATRKDADKATPDAKKLSYNGMAFVVRATSVKQAKAIAKKATALDHAASAGKVLYAIMHRDPKGDEYGWSTDGAKDAHVTLKSAVASARKMFAYDTCVVKITSKTKPTVKHLEAVARLCNKVKVKMNTVVSLVKTSNGMTLTKLSKYQPAGVDKAAAIKWQKGVFKRPAGGWAFGIESGEIALNKATVAKFAIIDAKEKGIGDWSPNQIAFGALTRSKEDPSKIIAYFTVNAKDALGKSDKAAAISGDTYAKWAKSVKAFVKAKKIAADKLANVSPSDLFALYYAVKNDLAYDDDHPRYTSTKFSDGSPRTPTKRTLPYDPELGNSLRNANDSHIQTMMKRIVAEIVKSDKAAWEDEASITVKQMAGDYNGLSRGTGKGYTLEYKGITYPVFYTSKTEALRGFARKNGKKSVTYPVGGEQIMLVGADGPADKIKDVKVADLEAAKRWLMDNANNVDTASVPATVRNFLNMIMSAPMGVQETVEWPGKSDSYTIGILTSLINRLKASRRFAEFKADINRTPDGLTVDIFRPANLTLERFVKAMEAPAR